MIHEKNNSITVYYLCYIPFGIVHLKKFLASYVKKKSGISHELVILFNGLKEQIDIVEYIDYLNLSGIKYSTLISQEKYDIGSYFFGASQSKTDYVMFLNTYARILHDNWLLFLYTNLIEKKAAATGCTGSGGDFGINPLHHSKNLFKKYTSLTIFYLNFYPFVKEHLRTNAFLIDRKIFLSLKYKEARPNWLIKLRYGKGENKIKTLCFEHGNNSMTNQLLKKGLNVLVVDKNGHSYSMDRWKESHTFWNGDQENLLVQDNQTQFYTNGDEQARQKLRYKAWKIPVVEQ